MLMKKVSGWLVATVAIVATGWLVPDARAEIVIDSFSAPAGTNLLVVSNEANSFATSSFSLPATTGTLGGERFLSAARVSGAGVAGDQTAVQFNGDLPDPNLSFNITAQGTYEGLGFVEWGNGADLNQSFESLGSNFVFVLSVGNAGVPANALDVASLVLELEDGDSDIASQAIPALSGGSIQSEYVWSSADFAGINFADVDRIRLSFSGQGQGGQAITISADSFVAAVPEPRGFLAMVTCGVGLVIVGRRRKNRLLATQPV
jgi:hypothetical protein